MARYSHRNSRRRLKRRSKRSNKRGGGYAFDLSLGPIGGMPQVIPMNDYFSGGARRSKSRSKRRSRKSRRSSNRRKTH